MNRRERKAQQKKKARQERLRQEKHQRQAPRASAETEGEDEGPTTADNLSAAVAPLSCDAAAGPAARSTASADRAAATRTAIAHQGPLDDFFLAAPARQWLDDLLAGTDLNPIVRVFDPVWLLPGELLLKASVCSEMLVAAELVAAGRGQPSRHLPAAAAAWLLEQDVLFSPGVVALAAQAVRRVGEFSELRQLWDAAQRTQEWLRAIEALHSRLQR